jgi:hypothetical protein
MSIESVDTAQPQPAPKPKTAARKTRKTSAASEKAKKPAPNRGGRPPSLRADERTLRQLRQLAIIQCTIAEAAGVLLVHENTLKTFLGPTGPKAAREVWDAGRQEGRASVRRKQFELAMRGNITMLIWWGKNNLGQADKLEKTETVDANISHSVEMPDLSTSDKIAALRAFENYRRTLMEHPRLAAPINGGQLQ